MTYSAADTLEELGAAIAADETPPTVHEEKDVWCVWTKFGRHPSYYHADRAGAETEAARLAHKHPGWKFIVMHMTGKFSVPGAAAEGVGG